MEDIYGEMDTIEQQLDELEHRGVELERKLRSMENGRMPVRPFLSHLLSLDQIVECAWFPYHHLWIHKNLVR